MTSPKLRGCCKHSNHIGFPCQYRLRNPLSEKKYALDAYNELAKEKIYLNEETEIRYELAVCYLALIEEVKKYVRYEPDNPTYIRNAVDSKEMFEMAFKLL